MVATDQGTMILEGKKEGDREDVRMSVRACILRARVHACFYVSVCQIIDSIRCLQR